MFLANITSGEVNLLGPFGLLVGPNYSRTQSTPRTGHQRNMPTKASALTGWPYYWRIATSRKKSGENKNFSWSWKTLAIVKVSEWGNYIFRLQFIRFTWRWWNAFSAEKDEKYAAKRAKRSLFYILLPNMCCSCGQWFSLQMLSSK